MLKNGTNSSVPAPEDIYCPACGAWSRDLFNRAQLQRTQATFLGYRRNDTNSLQLRLAAL